MTEKLTLPNDHDGISITALLHRGGSEEIMVGGRFSVICGENAVPEQPPETLKHLVLVVARSANYQALTPFKEVVVFEDDVKIDGNKCSASFNLNVMDHIAFDGEGDYYILCSLGTHLSNIAKVTIG